MSIVIRNALCVDIDPPQVRPAEIRIVGQRISEITEHVSAEAGDEVLDAGGAVVMPGLVNGHAHLYAALAAGMPAPSKSPSNFVQILQKVWWRLDRALDEESVEISGGIGALDALHSGTTTVIDHHASPNTITGSLDRIEAGINRIGLRGVLCYETTDRNGTSGRDAALAENERYAKRCAKRADGMFAAMIGAHAAFTMSDESLAAVADLAKRYGLGVHIHVAEDAADAKTCKEKYKTDLLDRLDLAGVLSVPSLLGHGTNLADRGLVRLNDSPVLFAHNPRSNMNNAVGYAPIAKIRRPVLLGTDGIGSDILAELQSAWFKSRDAKADITPERFVDMLAESARQASRMLSIELGKLTPGAAADILLTDYVPATPMTADNLANHLVFAMSSRQVRSVMIAGQWRLFDRHLVGMDEAQLRHRACETAKRLWNRMSELDG